MKKNQMEFLFVAGFVLGVALPNLLWKTELEESGLPGLYLLTRVSQGIPAEPEYFFYILKTRGAVYLLTMLCGLRGVLCVDGIPDGGCADGVPAGVWREGHVFGGCALFTPISCLCAGIPGSVPQELPEFA